MSPNKLTPTTVIDVSTIILCNKYVTSSLSHNDLWHYYEPWPDGIVTFVSSDLWFYHPSAIARCYGDDKKICFLFDEVRETIWPLTWWRMVIVDYYYIFVLLTHCRFEKSYKGIDGMEKRDNWEGKWTQLEVTCF